MNLDKVTDKEIQFNIMMALMKIEGHLSDMAINTASIDMMYGGEINDLAGTDKPN